MIRTVCSSGLLGMVFILTGCNTTTASIVGTSNTPINYTYAPGFNPPQVMYTDPIADSDNIPTGVNRDERLEPAINIQDLQQQLTIQQQDLIMVQDPNIF